MAQLKDHEGAVGFIGLGNMGAPMAANVLAAGFEMRVYKRTTSKAEPLVAKGARRVERAGDAARPNGVTITMVADDAALEELVLGEPALARRMAPGGIHLSMSTVAPATSRRLARAHADAGSVYVAAPVFGRPDAAAAKRLSICTSGPERAKAAVRPLLDAMGQRVFDFAEDPGAANVVKVSGNFLIAAALEAIGEALAMVEKSGVDRVAAIEMLSSTLFACPVYQGYGAAIAHQRFTPAGFRMALGLKDVELALRNGAEVKAPMPTASLVRDRFLSALAKGRGEMDWSAVALGAFEDAGLKPPG